MNELKLVCAEFGFQSIGSLCVNVRDCDECSGGDEGSYACFADSAGAAGYEGVFTLEVGGFEVEGGVD